MSVKIIIKDEINCKITGLDLHTRKELVNKFKFRLPYAAHLPSVRLGRWDGCINFFHLGGSSYINLLPEIIPIIEKYESDIELEDLRTYNRSFNFDKVNTKSYNHISWPAGHRFSAQPIELRDDQVTVINNFFDNSTVQRVLASKSYPNRLNSVLNIR